MSGDEVTKQCRQVMQKGFEHFQTEMTKIRTGRASAAMLDDVRVEYYGSMLPINQVATLSVPESRLIVITPWDKAAVAPLLKAIQKADLGLQPIDDGKVIRLSIPPLNEERRREIVKTAKKQAEESRVSIRNIRRESNEKLKSMQKAGDMTEDELRRLEDQVQTMTNEFIKKVDEALAHKEKEILEV